MTLKKTLPLLLLLSSLIFTTWASEDTTTVHKKKKPESSTAVGSTFRKIFTSNKKKRVRKDTFKRNSLGTKESTFSVGFEFEPVLIARQNFTYSTGGSILFGGSLDHYNKWLFGKIGIQKYTLGLDDKLNGVVQDSNIVSASIGLDYKSYFPKTVDLIVSPYILVQMETEVIIWEYKVPRLDTAGTEQVTDAIVNTSFGSGAGVTFFNRSNIRMDINLSAGVRLYGDQTLNLLETKPFDTDFYIRVGIQLWLSRED